MPVPSLFTNCFPSGQHVCGEGESSGLCGSCDGGPHSGGSEAGSHSTGPRPARTANPPTETGNITTQPTSPAPPSMVPKRAGPSIVNPSTQSELITTQPTSLPRPSMVRTRAGPSNVNPPTQSEVITTQPTTPARPSMVRKGLPQSPEPVSQPAVVPTISITETTPQASRPKKVLSSSGNVVFAEPKYPGEKELLEPTSTSNASASSSQISPKTDRFASAGGPSSSATVPPVPSNTGPSSTAVETSSPAVTEAQEDGLKALQEIEFREETTTNNSFYHDVEEGDSAQEKRKRVATARNLVLPESFKGEEPVNRLLEKNKAEKQPSTSSSDSFRLNDDSPPESNKSLSPAFGSPAGSGEGSANDSLNASGSISMNPTDADTPERKQRAIFARYDRRLKKSILQRPGGVVDNWVTTSTELLGEQSPVPSVKPDSSTDGSRSGKSV